MERPYEKEQIIERIRQVASEGKSFERKDLIGRWLGAHYSDDWRECLDELEGAGELTYDPTDLTYRKTIKPEIPKAYKGFRVIDGKLFSLVPWDWRPSGVNYDPPVLEYAEGEITYAPQGTQGIFFSKDLAQCKDTTANNGRYDVLKVIHEVTPLGEQTKGWDRMDVCPAVLVGKEVCRITPEPPRPKEEWIDVTKECTVAWYEATCTQSTGSYYMLLYHQGKILACFGLGQPNIKDVAGYKVEQGVENYLGGMTTIKVFKKVIT